MGKTCGACRKFLSPVGAATCSICPNLFHKGCLAIPESSTLSKDWICPLCKKNQKRGDNSSTPVKDVSGAGTTPLAGHAATAASAAAPATASTAATVGSPLPSVAQTLVTPHVASPAPASDSLLSDMRRELADYMAELRAYRAEMFEFRATVAVINERMDAFERRLEIVEQREVSIDTNQVAELERTVVQLRGELNDRDQEALSSDLDIGQLPEAKGENVVHSVIILAAKLGTTLEERDIVFAERVGAVDRTSGVVEGRGRRVVVRLARRHLRDELVAAARVRRTLTTAELGLGTPQQRIYLNERLTHFNRQLFYRVREECRKQNWRYSWTKRGRIYARQGDGKQAYPFRTEADVARIFQASSV